MGGPLFLSLVGAVALLALVLVVWQLAMSRRLNRELGVLCQQLEALKGVAAAAEQKVNFSQQLNRAEREQQLQIRELPRTAAEKYQYVASLAAQGFDAAGIASALQMAPAEVEQLLKLAQLKQQAGH